MEYKSSMRVDSVWQELLIFIKSFYVFIGQDNQAEQICGCL